MPFLKSIPAFFHIAAAGVWLFISFLTLSPDIRAQRDTLFWFVAPEVAQNHGDRPILFRFAAYGQGASVSVTQPANPAFPQQTFSIPASGSFTLDVTPWIDDVENKPANQVLNYGFRIHSSAPVSVYYEVNPTCQCNPDIFTLKGKNALGTQFVLPFQTFLNNASYARSRFDIVATRPNTQVTILPTRDLVGRPANVPFTIMLQEGQTYSGEALSTLAGQHPAGTLISSNEPIAVTLSDDSVEGTPYGGCRDILGDQTVPVNIAGDEYIVVRGYLNGPDKVFVVATQPGTLVSVDGNQVAALNLGQTYEHTLSNPAAYITSTAPVYVLHMSGFGCEVGQALLPPIKCTGSDEAAFVRSTNEFFALNILVEAGGEGGFSLNGNSGLIHAGQFSAVPGSNNQWMFAQVDLTAALTPGAANRLINTNSRFHVGLIHGAGTRGCRYGYFSDYAQYEHTILSPADTICEGSPILLNADFIAGASYSWIGPNGFAANGPQVQVDSSVVPSSGDYIVSGFVGNCPIKADTVFMWVQATPPLPVLSQNSPLCEGGNLTLASNYSGTGNFSWSGPNGLSDTAAILQIANLQLSDSGSYSLQILENNCPGPMASLPVNVGPVFYAAFSQSICPGDSVMLGTRWVTQPGTHYDSLLTQAGCDSISELNLAWYPDYSVSYADSICAGQGYTLPDGLSVQQAGVYVVKLSSVNGCDSLFTISLSVPDTFQVNLSAAICAGDSALMPDGTYRNQAGIYNFGFSSLSGCDSLVNVDLVVNPVWEISVQASVCFGEVHILPDGQQVSSAGEYWTMLQSVSGCDSLVRTTVSVLPAFTTVQQVFICADQSFVLPDGVVVSGAGSYSSLVVAGNGCDSLVTTELFVAPLYDRAEELTICQGDSAFLGGTWQKNQGLYLSLFSSAFGCDSLVNTKLILRGLPANFLPADTALCDEELPVLVSGFISYEWSNGILQSQLTINQPGVYTLHVSDSMGCKGTDTLHVKNSCPPTLYIPNSFTVNSDGINEIFRAYGTRIAQFEMRIFSRWGELIFFSDNINHGWGGSYNGELVPVGVYSYRIDVLFEGSIENPEPVFGKVSVLR